MAQWLDVPFIGHARCINASPKQMEWASRDRVFDPRITALSGDRTPQGGCLTSLITDNVRVGYLTFGEPVTITLWNLDWFGCAIPLRGRAKLEQYPRAPQGSNGPFFLQPNSDQHWQFSKDCELLVLRVSVASEISARIAELLAYPDDFDSRAECGQVMMELLPYRLHHGLSYARKVELLQTIRREFLQLFGFFSQQHPVVEEPRIVDPRAIRAMDYLRHLPADQFDLDAVCDIAHMSQRALYYAFKRNLRCTPYAYFQACRLIRVRLSLLQDTEGNFSITDHAAAEGLKHMGRFAAYYRSQFGELPSETRERALSDAMELS